MKIVKFYSYDVKEINVKEQKRQREKVSRLIERLAKNQYNSKGGLA